MLIGQHPGRRQQDEFLYSRQISAGTIGKTLTGTLTDRAESPQQGVKSLEIGLQIAMELVPAEVTSLSEFARRLDMPPSKVYRYMVSLMRSGIVERNPDTGGYRLGKVALQLGIAAQAKLDPLRAADAILDELHLQTGVPVAASIWTANGPVIVRRSESNSALLIGTRVGTPVSVVNSSIGRVFAAYLPEDVVAPLINAELADPAGPSARQLDAEAFAAIVAEVRANGIAFQRGDLISGIEAMAAPIFQIGDGLAMVISIVSLQRSGNFEPDGAFARLLRDSAQILSVRLGALEAVR